MHASMQLRMRAAHVQIYYKIVCYTNSLIQINDLNQLTERVVYEYVVFQLYIVHMCCRRKNPAVCKKAVRKKGRKKTEK